MGLILSLKATFAAPIEADGLIPEALGRLSAPEVGRLRIALGRDLAEVGDLFGIEGDASDGRLAIEGDLRRVSRIGSGMGSGHLAIRGDAGPDLGAGMTGGTIEVEGSAGDWAGAELRGGLIRIGGDAGHHSGAARPGSRAGMRGGTILIGGSAGADAGLAMRRGLIAVGGSSGPGLGRAMVAGSIFAFGSIGPGAGSGMKRGTLALLGLENPEDAADRLPPTFRLACRMHPPFIAIYLDQLRSWGVRVPADASSGTFDRYNGDLAGGGQGEVLAWCPALIRGSCR